MFGLVVVGRCVGDDSLFVRNVYDCWISLSDVCSSMCILDEMVLGVCLKCCFVSFVRFVQVGSELSVFLTLTIVKLDEFVKCTCQVDCCAVHWNQACFDVLN